MAAIPLQGVGDSGAGPWSAAQAQINSAGVEAAQHGKRFEYLERAIVRQHDAAATHANALRGCRYRANHHFRTVAGQAKRTVMFGEPVTVVTQAVGQAR